MYITTGKNSAHCTVTGQSIAPDEVRYTVDKPPAELGAAIKLWTADETLCLRTDTVADYAHPRIDGNTVILSNTTPAEPILPKLEDVQVRRIAESKEALAQYLASHPLTYTDGKQYSVTAEKQSLLTGNLAAYSIAVNLGITPNPLLWNTTGEECTNWTYEDLGTLALAIQAYVKPFVAYQQSTEIAINNCVTIEEVDVIVINYDNAVN